VRRSWASSTGLSSIERARQISTVWDHPWSPRTSTSLLPGRALPWGTLKRPWNSAAQRGSGHCDRQHGLHLQRPGVVGYTNMELGRIPEAAACFRKGDRTIGHLRGDHPKLNGQAGLAMIQFMSGHPEAIGALEQVIVP